MFSIRYDSGAHILHLRLWGFWSAMTMAAFAAELLARTTALHLTRRNYGVLSNSSDFPVQSPGVAAGFERIMAKGAARHHGPVAIVVASHLNKLQVGRTIEGERVRAFLTEAEARAWLAAAMT